MAWRRTFKNPIPWTSDDEAPNRPQAHHDVHTRPKALSEILWKATQRVAPAFRFLVADLQMAGLLYAQDGIIEPYVKLLKVLGASLAPSHVDAGRPEAYELVTLLGLLAVRSQPPPQGGLDSGNKLHGASMPTPTDPWQDGGDPWCHPKAKGKGNLQGKGISVPPPLVQTVEKIVEVHELNTSKCPRYRQLRK